MRNLLFALAVISAAWGIVSSIYIALFLSKHGVKINLPLFRILVLKYIHQYHSISVQESGKPGPWFYSYIISMCLALAFVIIGMLLG
jgi:hypothetical protein